MTSPVQLAMQRTVSTVKERTFPTEALLLTTDPADWIEQHFYIPELNGPMQLMPYQRAVLREAYRTDESGKFVYSVVVWSDIKKSIKSCIAAAVVLERASRLKWGSLKIIANDLKQADSRVAFYARRAIELDPDLFSAWKQTGYTTKTPLRTTIEAIPVDPKGEAGGNDDFLVFSELWAANQTAAQRMWTEMTLSPTKQGRSQRWVETYAGYSGESPLLERLYESGVKEGRQLMLPGAPEGLEVFANDAASLLVLWNTVPRCDWQTNEDGKKYYAQESATLVANEFRRVHLNQWVTSENVFVDPVLWDNCQGEFPEFAPNTPLVLAMDAGVSSDTFAIVGVSRIGTITYPRLTLVWKPPVGGKIDFDVIEEVIKTDLVKRFNVVQICYDPHQLHQMAMSLKKQGVAWMFEFSQMNERLVADKMLLDAITNKLIVHDGNDQLREHIVNANSKINVGDIDKLRIVKRAEHLKIDACVSLSMANHQARRLNL